MKAMLKYSLDFGENILSIPGGLTRENGVRRLPTNLAR